MWLVFAMQHGGREVLALSTLMLEVIEHNVLAGEPFRNVGRKGALSVDQRSASTSGRWRSQYRYRLVSSLQTVVWCWPQLRKRRHEI